jgi:hypothetical protein
MGNNFGPVILAVELTAIEANAGEEAGLDPMIKGIVSREYWRFQVEILSKTGKLISGSRVSNNPNNRTRRK